MELSRRWVVVWSLLIAAPMGFFATLLLRPEWDFTLGTSGFHFYVVSGTAIAAAIASAVIVGATQSVRETRLLFLGLAFLSIASIFAVHGLGTPGHIHAVPHAELQVSSWLSVMAGAFFAAMSAVTWPQAVEERLKRHGGVIFGAVFLLMGVYIGLSFATPNWLAFLPYDNRTVQLVISFGTITLLLFSAWRYFQAFLFARLPSQWSMVVALILLVQVQVSLTWGNYWHASWWLYHATYATAFVVLFTGWALEAKRAGTQRVIAEALAMRDAIAQLNNGYSRAIADLVDAIEWKDLYTLGHVRRVASYAVMIGKELSLSTLELRALALGAQMHDVGKIGVPDRILTKPGHLSAEEFDVIKEHVGRGHEIALKVAALRPVQDAIRYHYERIDGTGYPEGLIGDAIPLHARIVSVADAYDAMTSGRTYQAAVDRDGAIAELRRASGTQFDTRCVEAFVKALSKVQEEPTAASSRPTKHLEAAA